MIARLALAALVPLALGDYSYSYETEAPSAAPTSSMAPTRTETYLQRADPDLRHLDDDLAAPHGEGPRPGDARVLFMDPAAVRDAVRPSPFPLLPRAVLPPPVVVVRWTRSPSPPRPILPVP